MEIEQKVEILKGLDTKSLVAKLHEYEDELEQAMRDEAQFKTENAGFLGSGDCQRTKEILAELAVRAPETSEAGKKMTEAAKANWLQRQRTENEELSSAIRRQREVAFALDNLEISREITKKRLEGTRAILGLRAAQIRFLSEGG